jgi:hypothetical protein
VAGPWRPRWPSRGVERTVLWARHVACQPGSQGDQACGASAAHAKAVRPRVLPALTFGARGVHSCVATVRWA